MGGARIGTCYNWRNIRCDPCRGGYVSECTSRFTDCRACKMGCLRSHSVRAGDNCWALDRTSRSLEHVRGRRRMHAQSPHHTLGCTAQPYVTRGRPLAVRSYNMCNAVDAGSSWLDAVVGGGERRAERQLRASPIGWLARAPVYWVPRPWATGGVAGGGRDAATSVGPRPTAQRRPTCIQKPRDNAHAVVAEWLRRSIRNRLGVPAQVRILSTARHTFYPIIIRKGSAARSLLTTLAVVPARSNTGSNAL